MIIKTASNLSQKERARRKFKRWALLLLLLIIVVAGVKLSSMVKTKGYKGLWDFSSTVTSNFLNGIGAEPDYISIEISDPDVKKLEKNRRNALERGLIINDLDGDYVPATITWKQKKYNVKLRLKGHMTDHLQENKWSFRVKVSGKDHVMGMSRFSLQHPGTRGYIYEWIYHELMRGEGIIALRYNFVGVQVNGKDWGVYALEENFDDELLQNNGRAQGPIIRFNPDLYWVNRYSEMSRTHSFDEFASYHSATPEAYNEDKFLDDSVGRINYLKGLGMIEGLRERKIKVSEAFDIRKLATFHAIIDLVGGVHSIDWSDIKYYYNPLTKLLEPVAYESFSEFPSREITGAYKYLAVDSSATFNDWHTMIFSDEVFFAEYVAQLQRVSEKKYLDGFFEKNQQGLKKNLSILNKEFYFKKFETAAYYGNQAMIKKILSPPKALNAHFSGLENNKLVLEIGNIESMPVRVTGLYLAGRIIVPDHKAILPAKLHNKLVGYVSVHFSLPDSIRWSEQMKNELEIGYTILGDSKELRSPVLSFSRPDYAELKNSLATKNSNVSDFKFLLTNEENKIIRVMPGKHVVDKSMIIPAGYKVLATAGLSLDLQKGASITSYSALTFSGSEEMPVLISSSDSSSAGIRVISVNGSSFIYTVFKGFAADTLLGKPVEGALLFYESSVSFRHCDFYSMKTKAGVLVMHGELSAEDCLFSSSGKNAIVSYNSKNMLRNVSIENVSGNGFSAKRSETKLLSVSFSSCSEAAVVLREGSQAKGKQLKVKDCYLGISVEDISSAELQDVKLNGLTYGIALYNSEEQKGLPSLIASQVEISNTGTNYLKQKRSQLIINGKTIEESAKKIGESIKSGIKKNK
jgi:hypothetical protein